MSPDPQPETREPQLATVAVPTGPLAGATVTGPLVGRDALVMALGRAYSELMLRRSRETHADQQDAVFQALDQLRDFDRSALSAFDAAQDPKETAT